MNIAEIRQKYPQYNDMSDEELAQGLYKKFYSDMPYEDFSRKIGVLQEETPKQEIIPLTEEQKQENQQRAKEYLTNQGIDTSGWGIAKDALIGVGKGIGSGLERIASGLTFGGYDWASDKLGLGSRERVKELEEEGGLPMKFFTKGTQFVSGLIPTTYLTKAVGLPLAGAIEGGLSSGFDTDFNPKETAKGSAIGGAFGTALWGGGKLAKMAFGKRTAIKGVPRGLENAVQSDKGTKILDKAVKVDDKTARQVIDKAPEAMEELNRRAIKTLDKGLGSKVDISGEMSKAKKAYADFIDKNKANQVIGGKITPVEYQKNLKKWFKGSRVVDEKGKPLEVYHGTDAVFDVFDRTKGRSTMDIQGSFFSPYEIDAKGYGSNLKKVYLNIKNPADEGTAYKVLKKYAGQNNAGIKAREELQKLGYDGVFNGVDEYIAFEPNQIKAVSNSGGFTANPDIYDRAYKATAKASDLGLKDLSKYQENALKTAWKSGAEQLKPNESIGSLKHLDEMKKQLNKMITNSQTQKQTGIGLQDTPDTVALRELKGSLKSVMEKSGLSDISKQYAKANDLQNAYEMGLKYSPNNIKMRNLNFNPEQKSAFAQGLVEKITQNPEAKNIAGNVRSVKGALRQVMGDKAESTLKEISKLDEAYGRISSLAKKAEGKTARYDSSGFFGREQLESKGSMIGTLLDKVNDIATLRKASGAANYLLNPNKTFKPSKYDKYVQPALLELLSIGVPKLNRNIQGE